MTEYLTYASLTMNVVMLAALLSMRKQVIHLKDSLDLALELLEVNDK